MPYKINEEKSRVIKCSYHRETYSLNIESLYVKKSKIKQRQKLGTVLVSFTAGNPQYLSLVCRLLRQLC